MQAMDRDRLVGQVVAALRALGTADDFMNQAAAAALDMHTTDMHAGEVLEREGPMTVGELARAVGLSPGAATPLIDRLEAAGFATRVPDATSRRRVLVRPAEGAPARAYAVFGPLIDRIAAFLERYRDEELLLVRDFLQGMRAITTSTRWRCERASRAAPVRCVRRGGPVGGLRARGDAGLQLLPSPSARRPAPGRRARTPTASSPRSTHRRRAR
jgi:DNA-binding MarR family transcriptional regulator